MKPKTLIILLAFIVLAFLLQGAHLISEIQGVNKFLQSKSVITKDNLNIFCEEVRQFEYFLYLFAALIFSIVVPLLPFKRKTELSKEEVIHKLRKIKKRANIEKSMI